MDPRTEELSRRLRWGTVAASITTYFTLSLAVVGGPPVGVDGPFLVAFAAARNEALTSVVLVVTELGSFWTMVGLILLITVALWWVSKRSAAFFLLGAAGAGLLNLAAKLLVERPRPYVAEVVEAVYPAGGWSFPSGHAMGTMGFALSVFFVCRRLRPRIQWLTLAFGMTLTGSVGASRLYLGVHYPSDVLAGWALGAAWVVVLYAWYRRAFGVEPPEHELARPSLVDVVEREEELLPERERILTGSGPVSPES